MFLSEYILPLRPEPEAVATKKQKLDVSMVFYVQDVLKDLCTTYIIGPLLTLVQFY